MTMPSVPSTKRLTIHQPRRGGSAGTDPAGVKLGSGTQHRGGAVRGELRRQRHGAVLALPVLQQRDDSATHRYRGPVESVQNLHALLAAQPNVQAPRLVVGRVRARRQLAIAPLARQPRLAVVLLRRRVTEVADGDVDYAIGQLERGEDLLLDREDALVLFARALGLDEAEHLHLVELVHTEDPARVLSRRPR